MAHLDDPQTQKANMDYIRQSMNTPLLEKEHELALARRWRDHRDERALHELVKSYARLVVAIAAKFRHYGLPMGDLIQEGNVGLMQAAMRFDPERDLRFSTYSSWWVRAAIQDYVLRNWSIVRTGTTAAQKSLFFNLRRLRAKLGHGDLTDASRQSIAKELNVHARDVVEMEQRFNGGDQSLNATIGESGETDWQSLLADDAPNPEEIVIGMRDAKTRSRWLKEALDALSDRERQIIKARHLNNQAVVTLEDLGKTLGISKERVRQLEQRAMEKLKLNLGRHTDKGERMFA